MTNREVKRAHKEFMAQRFRRSRTGVLTAAELHKLWDHLSIWAEAKRIETGISPADSAWHMEGIREALGVVLPELVDDIPGGWPK